MKNDIKYGEWLEKWLELYVKPFVKIRTYEKYSQVIKNHIKKQLGEIPMRKITPQVLQRLVASLCSHLSSGTVNQIISVMKQSIAAAVKAGETNVDFTNSVKRPKNIEKKVECFSLKEQKTIEKYIIGDKSYKYAGIIICLYTGLRIGELLALELKDVNLSEKLIYVNKSCHYGRNFDGEYERIIDTTKTVSGERVIPIPKALVPYIRHMREKNTGIYLISRNDKPISTRTYQNLFSSLLKKLSIPHKGFHSLRHTFATRAIESGMDVKTLSEILGHKSPDITLKRYTHSLMENKIASMNRLGKIFSDAE